MTKYYICGGNDSYWLATNAKTLRGAKTIAGKKYQFSIGGKIEIAEKTDDQYLQIGDNGI